MINTEAEPRHESSKHEFPVEDLCRNLLNPTLQSPQIRPTNPLPSFLPILQKRKGRHGSHAKVLGHLSHLIDIDLDESHIGVLLAELADFRGNGLAGTAPGGIEVDDDGAGGCEGFKDDLAVCIA